MTVSTESAMTSRRHEREVHALVAHRDAVGDRDRAELQRVSPAGVHALLRALREAVEAQVAGRDLVPRARDADLGLVPVGVAHADGAKHSARGGGFDSVGDGAGTRLDIVLFRHGTRVARSRHPSARDGRRRWRRGDGQKWPSLQAPARLLLVHIALAQVSEER